MVNGCAATGAEMIDRGVMTPRQRVRMLCNEIAHPCNEIPRPFVADVV